MRIGRTCVPRQCRGGRGWIIAVSRAIARCCARRSGVAVEVPGGPRAGCLRRMRGSQAAGAARAAAALLLVVAAWPAFAAPATAPASCQRPALPVACAGPTAVGRFIARNAGPWQPYAFAAPLDVPAGQTLAIAICGQANQAVQDAHWPALASLLPTLVHRVGNDATLAILVQDSANVALGGRLTLGEDTLGADGTLHAPTGPVQAALIGTLVDGPIGAGARVDLYLRDAANVSLQTAQSRLHLGGGSLSERLIAPRDAAVAAADGACLEVVVERSDRVRGGQGTLTIGGGRLQGALIAHPLRGGRVAVQVDDVANVVVDEVRLFAGQLLDEALQAGPWLGGQIAIALANAANVDARALDIQDAVLVDELVDAGQVQEAAIELRLADTGNASVAGALRIRDGGLIDEPLDAADLLASDITVTLLRSGNAVAADARIVDGELIDEAIDAGAVQDATLAVRFEDAGNLHAATARIEEGELIDEAIDAASFDGGTLDVGFANSGNVTGGTLAVVHGELIDEAVDLQGTLARAHLRLDMADAGNARVETLDIVEGELVDELLDLVDARDASVELRVRRSANAGGALSASGQRVSVVYGELMDEVIDAAGALDGFAGVVDLGEVANARAAHIALQGAQLLDGVLDAAALRVSELGLQLADVANARYRDALEMRENSTLLGTLADVDSRDAASQIATVVVASGEAIQVP
ncbi:hypothetical protein [Xanthomonas sacchari]|uniref:hypothetical protein n=1 Tax=Xanthomonas sacchari TaxID=56458 RepID=UPI0020C2359F|nr:hypothetical protein [Xanthomonas sacchari]